MAYSKKNPYSISERNQRAYSTQFGPGSSPYNEYDNYTQRNRFYNDADEDQYENEYDVYASDRYQDEEDDFAQERNFRNQTNPYFAGRQFNQYGRSYQQNRFQSQPSNYGREAGYNYHPNYGRESSYFGQPNNFNNGFNNRNYMSRGYVGNNFNERVQYGPGSAHYTTPNYGRPYSAFEAEFNTPFQNQGTEFSRRRRRNQFAY